MRLQTSAAMRPWNNAQRAVVFLAVVEVQANRQHAFEDFDGRLDVRYTRLNSPAVKS